MADDRMKVSHQQAALVFSDLIDSLVVDIATEAHRAARLGFDYKLNVEEEEEVRLAALARAVVGDGGAGGAETGNKHTVDVFGQTHPTIANEMFECMNCGRPIVAGRFAPHLEKCMGKGRKARIKASRNLHTSQHRRSRSSPVASFGGTVSTAPVAHRTPHRTPVRTLDDNQRERADVHDGESEESRDNDETGPFYSKPRPKKGSREVWTGNVVFSRLSGSGLVPVPLYISPVKASCAASVASLAEASLAGSMTGVTVEVAVEQFDSFVSGRVPISVGLPIKKGSKLALFGQDDDKSRKMGEKRKTWGHVLAGTSVWTGSRGKWDASDSSGQTRSFIELDGNEPGPYARDGPVGGVYDPIHDHSHPKTQSADLTIADSGGNFDNKQETNSTPCRIEGSTGPNHVRLDIRVDVGTWICPLMDDDQGRSSTKQLFDFGKRKKRPRATFNPIQGQASVITSTASGDDNWVTVIEVLGDGTARSECEKLQL